jgi:membrane-associated phospholipid phosphatase
MKFKIVILILCLTFPFKNIAQKPAKKIRWKAPVALGVASLLLYNASSKEAQSTIYRNNFSNFSTKLDDILQYTPAILNVGLGLSGLEAKNSRQDCARVFILGTVIYVATTQGLKYAINETRPNGTEHSFPSGHTASAFALATILSFSVKDNSLKSIGLLLGACIVGFSRTYLSQHFLVDVTVGSAIGVVSAYILLAVLPNTWFNNHSPYLSR